MGARQKAARQYRDELSVVRSTRGEGKACPAPCPQKKTTRPWCVAFAGKVHPKNRPTAIGGLQGAVCNCVSSGETISVCVGNRVLTNTNTVRTIWGAGGWCESHPPVAGIDRSVVGTKCVLLGWEIWPYPARKKNRKLRCPPPEESAQKKG